MNKLFAAAALALVAAAATVQTASAFPPIKLNPLFPKHSEGTSVGDAFQPFQRTASESELRAACEQQGGELKKQFDGQDFQFVCVG